MRDNLIDRRFGKLRVVSCGGTSKDGRIMWNCICDCGNTKIVRSSHLTQGKINRCGRICLTELVGVTFNKLTAIKRIATKSSNGSFRWLCKCECGNEKEISQHRLLAGEVKHCGCDTRVANPHRKLPEYSVWVGIKARCYGKYNASYFNYGGRGIVMHDSWLHDYLQFVKDVGQRPTSKHQLDRINNDGNYEPGNVRWVLPSENNLNTRRNVFVAVGALKIPISHLAKNLGVSTGEIRKRYATRIIRNDVKEPRFHKSDMVKYIETLLGPIRGQQNTKRTSADNRIKPLLSASNSNRLSVTA